MTDHRYVLGVANELYDAIAVGSGKPELGVLLDQLVAHTECHFAREEELFTFTRYHKAAAHKQEHRDLVERLLDIQRRHNSGESTMTVETMIFLKDCLFGHIMGSDAEFGPRLNASGVR
jgi:hemerythrin-like metal-binding protein